MSSTPTPAVVRAFAARDTGVHNLPDVEGGRLIAAALAGAVATFLLARPGVLAAPCPPVGLPPLVPAAVEAVRGWRALRPTTALARIAAEGNYWADPARSKRGEINRHFRGRGV